MSSCIEREPGERPSTTGHRGPAARGGKVGAAERRAEAVVDHLLRAHSLASRQASVAERRGGSADEDCGRHVLGPPARVRPHLLLLGGGGRQNSLRGRLQQRLAERLDPRRQEAGADSFERVGRDPHGVDSCASVVYGWSVVSDRSNFPFVAPLPADGAPSRSSRWSPTRSALAIAVSAGFTALDEGKKLVSTT